MSIKSKIINLIRSHLLWIIIISTMLICGFFALAGWISDRRRHFMEMAAVYSAYAKDAADAAISDEHWGEVLQKKADDSQDPIRSARLRKQSQEFFDAIKEDRNMEAKFLLLKNKYKYAAHYPFLPVSPDPPVPVAP